jgi:primosomal protein N' (replication factor Y)
VLTAAGLIGGAPALALLLLLVAGWVKPLPGLLALVVTAGASLMLARLWLGNLVRLREAIRRAEMGESEEFTPPGPALLPSVEEIAEGMRRLARSVNERAELVLRLRQADEAIVQRLERREQTILFLNRRGYSTSLQCPHCGFVAGCPNCSVSLTFHRASMRLLCHVCGHAEAAPSACPKPECGHAGIRYAGLGTERVEETLSRVFPKARIARMDRDTLHRKDDYRRILGDFRSGRIDILVGTQMIAKGLHFPNVTLVGVLHADLSLHVPDFRSGERTFQLLTQVSGRAGRGDVEGEVFVQSFTPFHPAIQFSRRHDYQGFYEAEVETREALKYPPFSRIALLTLRGRNEDKVRLSAEYLRKELDRRVGAWPGIVIAGPAPAPLLKAESFFRHQLMVRCKAMSRLAVALAQLEAEATLPEDVRLVIDVDPVSLM